MTGRAVRGRTRSSAPTIGRLASAFQEPLTAVARVRGLRSAPGDANAFRRNLKQLLVRASDQARADRYGDEATELAVYAIVGLIDAVVLESPGAMRDAWAARPLEEEVFGHHVAGEQFFSYLNDLLKRREGVEVSDVLEVYLLCLYLGFEGRYAEGSGAELGSFIAATEQKIERIRGPRGALSEAALPPAMPAATPQSDDRIGRLMGVGLAVSLVGLVLLIAGLKFLVLSPGVDGVRALVGMP